jgi:hypothetical protein
MVTMRRLLRHLFTLSSTVSLLLCVAVCVLWVRSYFRADWAPLIPRVNRVRFDSWQGRLFVIRVRFPEDRPTYLRMESAGGRDVGIQPKRQSRLPRRRLALAGDEGHQAVDPATHGLRSSFPSERFRV